MYIYIMLLSIRLRKWSQSKRTCTKSPLVLTEEIKFQVAKTIYSVRLSYGQAVNKNSYVILDLDIKYTFLKSQSHYLTLFILYMYLQTPPTTAYPVAACITLASSKMITTKMERLGFQVCDAIAFCWKYLNKANKCCW